MPSGATEIPAGRLIFHSSSTVKRLNRCAPARRLEAAFCRKSAGRARGKSAQIAYRRQGANDPRVPRSEAEPIVRTVHRHGTPVWYLLALDEGHGFARKSNVDFAFYTRVMFAEQCLGTQR